MDEPSSSCTVTQRLQTELERAVGSIYEAFGAASPEERSLMLTLHHDDHEEFVVRGLRRLSAGYDVLDSSRPWVCYWILHSLALLGRPVGEDLCDRTVDFLKHCQVAHLLDIMVPELLKNVGEHVRSCQTYEGGIGGEPGAEAHGGYTFCGLAALALINQPHVLDLPTLVNWVAFRQGWVEGGFQGRTNKLVDGCYSFWEGGCFQLLQQHMPKLVAQQTTSAAAPHAVTMKLSLLSLVR